jgi:hypothetical protein
MSAGGRQFLNGGTIPASATSDGQLVTYRFLKTGRYLVICMNPGIEWGARSALPQTRGRTDQADTRIEKCTLCSTLAEIVKIARRLSPNSD